MLKASLSANASTGLRAWPPALSRLLKASLSAGLKASLSAGLKASLSANASTGLRAWPPALSRLLKASLSANAQGKPFGRCFDWLTRLAARAQPTAQGKPFGKCSRQAFRQMLRPACALCRPRSAGTRQRLFGISIDFFELKLKHIQQRKNLK